MTLEAGVRLGPYEIVAPVGAGGMGEVYRARDPRLGREVAVKILPEELSRDPERLRRFEKEARAAAALNHPNILDVHDIGFEEGTPYIVSELLDGETLRPRLRFVALPPRKAIDYAVQIAQGLAAAHEKGILHRDLKPENLFITKDSRVKILDFGLAKLRGPRAPVEGSVSERETVSQTSPGVALGTAGYMSPEQVKGEPIDTRSDIFSFGAVLYEMLSGRRAFRGETTVQTMNAILTEDPPALSSVNPALPPVLERIVNRCLEKQPEDRFHSAHDLGIALQTLSGAAGEASWESARLPAVRSRWRRWKVALGAAGLIAIGALAVLVLLSSVRLPSDARPVAGGNLTRFTVPLPAGQTFKDVGYHGPALAISPDGREIVYVARDGETTRLYHRPVDALEAEAIPGTEGAHAPFFSPDGSAVGFFANSRLQKVLVRGGAPIELADVPECYSGDWGRDGTIVYGLCSSGLTRVPAAGGPTESLTRSAAPAHQFPQLLRDGRALLFTEWHSVAELRILALDLETGDQRVVIERGTGARYLPTGHVVYAWAGDLWAVPFDLEHLTTTAPPVRVVEGVLTEEARGAAHFAVSDEGTLVYLPGGLVGAGSQLAWVDSSGSIERLPVVDVSWSPRVSPDGTRLLFCRESGGVAIWVHDLARGVERKLSTEGGGAFWAVWGPDSESIVFNSRDDAAKPEAELLLSAADGGRPAARLTELGKIIVPYSLSGDGAVLAFTQVFFPRPGSDIWTLSMTGDAKPLAFLRERFQEVHPALSPDGNWIAYASDETGRYEVSVRPFPGPGGLIPISAQGGWEPIWSPDGKTLYYRNEPGNRIMAVSFDGSDATLRPGRPELAVEGPFQGGMYLGRGYDLGPDGRFLVVLQDEPPPPPTHYNIVLNWFEELKRLVPAD